MQKVQISQYITTFLWSQKALISWSYLCFCDLKIFKITRRYMNGCLVADDYPSDFLDIFSAPNQLDELR